MGGEPGEFEAVGEVADDVEGAGPDRPGRPEHGDPVGSGGTRLCDGAHSLPAITVGRERQGNCTTDGFERTR